mmetsp:Transcript_18793/g.75418  ORF Transcript_18793/g.75418 Transcript_18793/m.75418 type:complete len:90 (-) Transcript_18793:2-271(-)
METILRYMMVPMKCVQKLVEDAWKYFISESAVRIDKMHHQEPDTSYTSKALVAPWTLVSYEGVRKSQTPRMLTALGTSGAHLFRVSRCD